MESIRAAVQIALLGILTVGWEAGPTRGRFRLPEGDVNMRCCRQKSISFKWERNVLRDQDGLGVEL